MPLSLFSTGYSRASAVPMPSSSDCACRVVVPLLSLPTTRMPMPTPRFQNSGSLHCPIGTMTAARRHMTSSLGITPMIEYKRSFNVIVRPTICGSPPKRVRQKSDVRTTTGAPPFLSSSGANGTADDRVDAEYAEDRRRRHHAAEAFRRGLSGEVEIVGAIGSHQIERTAALLPVEEIRV